MALRDYFRQDDREEVGYSWCVESLAVDASRLEDLVRELAETFISDVCSPTVTAAWFEARRTGEPPPPEMRMILVETMASFGKPPHAPETPNRHHIEAAVAEQLWYYLREEERTGTNGDGILRVEKPHLTPTSSGGDSLVVHRTTDGGLLFRLWELKKCVGASLSATVSTAYKQLNARGIRYLVQMSAIGQERFKEQDLELAVFYSQLPVLWVEGAASAAAGISVTTSDEAIPTRCFTRFPDRFPNLVEPARLRGLLTACGNYPDFVDLVQEELWSGL